MNFSSSVDLHRFLTLFLFCLQLTFSEPLGATTASQFEAQPVQGRKVSKVVKTTVVRGERVEKQRGDPSLAADLPSAQEDFEKVSESTFHPDPLLGRSRESHCS